MSTHPTSEVARSWADVAADLVRGALGLTTVFWLLRAYELFRASRAHALPERLVASVAVGMSADLFWALQLSATVGVLLIVIAAVAVPVARHTARRLQCLVAGIAVAIGVMLSQYFAVTLVPLGADLFGYSVRDIRETVGASSGVGVGSVLAVLVFAAMAWFAVARAQRVELAGRRSRQLGAGGAVLLLLGLWLAPRPDRFATESGFSFATNKSAYFVKQSSTLLRERLFGGRTALAGFPLMHADTTTDVLGPLMNLSTTRPNLVFVIVEGLGRDFTGPKASLGGFTPFLDSLAERSITWDNFLSTSGRTFGVLPSMMGSLPFGASGFMELRDKMPPHLTLYSLLRERGYLTRHFEGTDPHFDFIDQFLERQGVETIVGQSSFDAGYSKQPGVDGFSWGYPDDAVFRFSLAKTPASEGRPRLDSYLTITSHEPFIPPRQSEFAAEYRRRLAGLPAERQKFYEAYPGIFTTLLYTDDALRQFFAAYAKRPEYAHTIFFVTGDHRLIPIPAEQRIDRYRVPFLIYSPMLKAPRHVRAVSSHLDVAPSVVALLKKNYGMAFPDSVAWLGGGLDTAQQYRSRVRLALMRTKNAMDEYVDGDLFLAGNQLYALDESLGLRPSTDGEGRTKLTGRLKEFAALNRFTTSGPHVIPGTADLSPEELARRGAQDSTYRALDLDTKPPTFAFDVARKAAFARRFPEARLVLERLLRDVPNYHDARALLGRTYGWEQDYPRARAILQELLKRAPQYADGWSALSDVERWSSDPKAALAAADSGLRRFPQDPDLAAARKRALNALAGAAAGAAAGRAGAPPNAVP